MYWRRVIGFAGIVLLVLSFLPEGLPEAAGLPIASDDEGVWDGRRGVAWAVGIGIPEDNAVASGDSLDWSGITNMTAVVVLPNITSTDGVIYAILSGMTLSGSVIQVAAGLFPGDDKWLAYVFLVYDVSKYPQSYEWIVNRTMPEMKLGDKVALSMYYRGEDGWMYRVENLRTKISSQGPVLKTPREGFKGGDQEVFALEAYTLNPKVFEGMRELVLESIYFNGARFNGESYVLSGWDLVHNPLFLVGGGNPPPFISVAKTPDGVAKWVYSPSTVERYTTDSGLVLTGYFVIMMLVATLAVCVLWLSKKLTMRGPFPKKAQPAARTHGCTVVHR